MFALTRAPAWARSQMNPVSTIRISLLLRQSRLKKFSDPSRLNCCQRVAIHRESRQTRRRSDQVFQRVGKMTRWCWYVARRGSIRVRRFHHSGLNRRPRSGCYKPVCLRRVTRAGSGCAEEIPRIINRRQTGLSLLVPPPHHLVGRVQIHRKLESL